MHSKFKRITEIINSIWELDKEKSDELFQLLSEIKDEIDYLRHDDPLEETDPWDDEDEDCFTED